MPYKNKEKQREAVRASMAKRRVSQESDVKPDSCETRDVKPVLRINPASGMPYMGMLEIPEGALREYERHWGQAEPVYYEGNVAQLLAEIAIDPRFERIARSLGPLGSEVRVGMFGPDVASLWEATH